MASPIKKRFKMDYDDIESYVRSLNNLRLNLSDLIDQICSVETTLWMNKFERTELNINNIDVYDIPEVDTISRSNLKEHVEQEKKMCDHIKFLNILKHKQKCNISKLIDVI
ncbi:uncharacterized protein LOC143200712 isoform X2 [Rhynchophorus ferrugineus]|uniref:uncharacterized protein LOC143200712 isoform X2 n=1 Tax=Rhynchophorus ferrugineus TaxID=354439 RepID=UPI003FCC7F9F